MITRKMVIPPIDVRTRFKLENLINKENRDGYISISGLIKTHFGYKLSNGENRLTIKGKKSRVEEIIGDIEKIIKEEEEEEEEGGGEK